MGVPAPHLEDPMDATQQPFLSDEVDLTAAEPQAQVARKRKGKSKRGDEQAFFE